MNKRSIILTTALMLVGIACKEPTVPIPEWALDTRWRGTATMQSGVELELVLTLGRNVMGDVDVIGASLKGNFNEVRLYEDIGGVDPDQESTFVWFQLWGGETLDGVVRACATGGGYHVEAALTASGEFHGTIAFSCSFIDPALEVQTIVLRRFDG